MKKAKSLGLRKLRAEIKRLKSVMAIHEKDSTNIAMYLGVKIAKQAKMIANAIDANAKQDAYPAGRYFIHQNEY